MAGDIEEFLRRAAARRAQQQSRQAPPARRPPAPQADVIKAEIVEEAEVVEDDIYQGKSVAEHVARHLQAGEFAQRAAHLGEEVDQSDDRMEAHLQQYFEHDLGDLGARTSAAEQSILDDDDGPPVAAAKEPAADDFLAFLADPNALRRAIILREVFERPAWW